MRPQAGLAGRMGRVEAPWTRAFALQIGKVFAVHPQDNAVDVVLLTGGIIRAARVLSPQAGTKAGRSYLPAVQVHPGSVVEAGLPTQVADTYAVVAYLEGDANNPIILGFLYPEVSELLFADEGRDIERHQSGVYRHIAPDGTWELVFPDGVYIRWGVGTTKEDLTGKDYDKRWKVPAVAQRTLVIKHPAGGQITFSPDGTLTIAGDVKLEGIDWAAHVHTDPQGGTTGPPQ